VVGAGEAVITTGGVVAGGVAVLGPGVGEVVAVPPLATQTGGVAWGNGEPDGSTV
jgi:hypothetical protein